MAFVTVIVTLNHLGPQGFGEFQTVASYTALITVLIDLGFNVLYVREAARNPTEISRYLQNLVSVRLLLSLAALAVLAGALYGRGLGGLLLPGFLLMVLTSYSNLLRNTFYALQRLGWEVAAILLESTLLLGLVVAGRYTHQGVGYFLGAYAASYGFSCVYFLVVLQALKLARIRWRLELDFVRRWLWSGLPFAFAFVLTILYFRIDVPLLNLLRSNTEVGWYGAAYKPFEALLFIPLTLLQVAFPVFSVLHQRAPDKLRAAINSFFKGLLLVGWPLTVGTFLLAPGLDRLLFLYPESAPALRILALAFVFAFVNNAFIGALNSIDRQVAFSWAAGISLIVNLGLNLVLIPLYGYLGASWATVLTEVALGAAGWVLTARYLGQVPVFALSWKVVLAGLVMGAAVYPLRDLQGFGLVGAVGLGAAVYAIAVVLLRAVERGEIDLARQALWRDV